MKLPLSLVGQLAGWAWTAIAGVGGAWALYTRGPWPPTNGWFAFLSGLAACPLLAWSLKRYTAIKVSGWVQFAAALFFFVAGRIALIAWPHD